MKDKIDLKEMDRLFRQGKCQTEVAEILGVTSSAVCQARQKQKKHLVTTVALEKSNELAEDHLDLAGQLRKANRAINEQIDRTEELIVKADATDEIISLKTILVKELSELRQQANAHVAIFEAYRDFKEFEQFKNAVIEILADFVPPEKRNDAIKTLKKRGLLRGSVKVD